MKGKIAKERCIYSNYDLLEQYPDDYLIEILLDCERVENKEAITDDVLWEERYRLSDDDWEIEKENLTNYFNEGYKFILVGSIGRWNGVYRGGFIFSTFDEMYRKATKDCDYIHFYDENGHLYLSCSHHDGTCSYEIKEITDKGIEYLENWEDNWNDKRTEEYVHAQIFNKYSKLPNFAHKVYGCKKREYEPISKGRLIDVLNNQAKSFYC